MTPEQKLAFDQWKLRTMARPSWSAIHSAFLAGWDSRVFVLPTRENIANAIRGQHHPDLSEPPWEELSEERRKPWLDDADRVLALITGAKSQ